MRELDAWWPEVERFISESSEPVIITVYRPREGNDGSPVATWDVTTDAAALLLSEVRGAASSEALAAMAGEQGGPGEVSLDCCRGLAYAGRAWVDKVLVAPGPVRIRVRNPSGHGISRRLTIPSREDLAPHVVDAEVEPLNAQDHLNIVRSLSALQVDQARQGADNLTALAGAMRVGTAVQDDRWRKLFDTSAQVQTQALDTMRTLLEDLRTERASHLAYIGKLQEELRMMQERSLTLLREDQQVKLRAEADAHRVEQIGLAVRELGAMGLSAAQLVLMAKFGISPEQVPALDLLMRNPALVRFLTSPEAQAALLDPDLQAALRNPALQTLLADPQFQALVANPEVRGKLLAGLLAYASSEAEATPAA